jgi:ribosomal protein S18 acetylase RimI-like enzyme
MSAPAFQIRRATPADAGVLEVLGPETFREAFGNEFPAEAINERMAVVYARERLESDLQDPAQAWFLAQAGTQPLGFLAMKTGSAPDCVHGKFPLEISRVYVHESWHGRGPAFALMEAAFEEARARAASTLWLQAWERNPKAMAFYRAHGFRRAGEVTVCFAGKELPHLVLVRPLRREA